MKANWYAHDARRSGLWGYGIAVAAVAGATLLKLLLATVIQQQSPFILFFGTLMVVAWLGGRRAGLLATVLAVLSAEFFFMPPYFSFALENTGQILWLAVFFVEGGLASLLVSELYRARRRAEVRAAELQSYQENLREDEERSRRLADEVVEGLALSENGKIFDANKTFTRMFGYELDELIGMEVGRFIAPEDREQVANRIATDSAEAYEVRGLRKDGAVFPVEIRPRSVFYQGRKIRVTPVIDLTERTRAQEDLRQSEERYRAVVEQAAEGIFLVEPATKRFLEANTEYQRMLGYTSEELLGMTLYDVVAHDRENIDHYFQRSLEEKKRVIGERRHRRRDGSVIDVVASSSLVFYGGRQVVCYVVRDITERKRVENSRRFMSEASVVLASSLDYQRTLASVARLAVPVLADWCAVDVVEEDGAVQRLAVAHEDPEKVSLAHELQERYPQDPRADFGVPRVLRTEEPELMPEIPESLLSSAALDEEHRALLSRLDLRSYMIVPLLARGRTLGAITLVMSDSGRRYDEGDLEMAEDLAHRAAFAIDNARLYEDSQREISERKRTESMLEAQAEDLRRSNAELEQFAYVASHDLQEPLRMVSSYTQLLARRYKDQLDDDAGEFIGYAVDGANRMQQLINDLLVYSRVGTQGKEFKPTECDAVFAAARDNLRMVLEETGAELVSGPLPTVMGDRSQLTRLLQNLIGNALKFRGQESPEVHVQAELREDEWVFSVRDNGIGIEPEYVDRIFVIFQRLHDRVRYSGTGIGLAVCKKIVERHGGRIWVESVPGEGSTFYFTLPVLRG